MIFIYKLISSSDIKKDDVLHKVLENRGIKEVERFLEPSLEDEIHYSKLVNIDKAVTLFAKIVQQENAEIVIVVDADPDGNTSAAILAAYIEENFKNVNLQFIFHEGKAHGLTKDIMKQIFTLSEQQQIDLLIIPDAGSSDFKQHQILAEELDIPTIVIDHHPLEGTQEKEHAIIVNNQMSPDYANKQLSGVGIVYKFLTACDSKLNLISADDNLDLVALGNIADSMDLSSFETRYLVYKGLKNINNPFLKEIIKSQLDGQEIHPQALSFGVIPKLNGVIRVGTMEEKIDLFDALRGVERTSVNERSRTKKIETLAEKATRQCVNAHKRQKIQRQKWYEKVDAQIKSKQLHKNAFLLIELDESFSRELGGLIAGQLAQEYRKPVLMLIWDSKKKSYSGSLRGYDGVVKDTKSFLENLGLFSFLGGHKQAAGFSITEENYRKLNEAINANLDESLQGANLHEVDFILQPEDLTQDVVKEVTQYDYLWGKGAEKPKFAIDIQIDTSKIYKAKTSNMINFYYNDVKFVQFTGDRRLLNFIELKEQKMIELSIVGNMSINQYNGTTSYQFLIEDVELGNEVEVDFTKEDNEKKDFLDELFDW